MTSPRAQSEAASVPPTDWQRKLPNALTIFRVGLAAAVVALLSTLDLTGLVPEGQNRSRNALWALSHPAVGTLALATALFVVAAGTDALDGALARRWSVVSRFGRIMDPFADKLLILGTFAVLAGPSFAAVHQGERLQLSGVLPWMVVVMLARELVVTSIRGAYEAEGIDFSAGPMGKLKMILQSIAAPRVMLMVAFAVPLPGTGARALILTLVWATVIATALSALPYITKAMRAASTEGTPPAPGTAPSAAPRKREPKSAESDRSAARRERPTPELGVPTERVEVPAARTKRKRSAKAKARGGPKSGSGASARRKPGNSATEDPDA